MNPYYRCFEAADGFVAVACLNLAQRLAFLSLLDLEDATVEAPDVVPGDPVVRAEKERVTESVVSALRQETVATWLGRFADAGVPCGPVLQRESVHSDPQVAAECLVGEIDQPGLGAVRLLAPFVRVGGNARDAEAAPALGADTASVLEELA